MEERLVAKVEADIKDFQDGMQRVQNNLMRAEQMFKNSSKSVFRLENAIAKLSQQYKSGSVSEKTYTRELDRLNNELKEQRANVQASSKEVKRLNVEMDKGSMMKVANTNKAVSQSFNNLGGSVRGTTGVTMEFNRIIQDAPFGLMGVGNNIQQLAGNFSYLQKTAGGTGPAVKAALMAMISPANLALLSITALTAGFTAYQMGAFDFLSANKKKKKSLEDLQESLDEYRKTLDAVSQKTIEGTQNAQEQISMLDALSSQAENTALSHEKRTDAVRELQRLYPDYFSNLTEEQILNGEVSEEMAKLRTNLIETARAYAMIDRVKENSIALLDLEGRALTRAGEILEKTNKLRELQAEAEDLRANPNIALAGQALESIDQSRVRINDELNKLLKEQSSDSEEIGKINKENLELEKRRNEALEEGGNLVKSTVNTGSSLKNLIKHSDQLDYHKQVYGDIIKLVQDGVNLTNEQALRYDALLESLKDHEKQLERIDEIDISFNINDQQLAEETNKSLENALNEIKAKEFENIPVKVDFQVEQLDYEAQAESDAWDQMWKDRLRTVEHFSKSMERTLGRSFENSIMSGDNFFQSIEEGFKRMLARLAAQLAASLAIKVLATIVGGPMGGAIAGGASSSLFGGFRADGGSVTSGKAYVVGENGPEVFVPQTGGTIIPNRPEVSTPQSVGAMSNKIQVEVVGQLRGDEMYLQQRRAGRTMDRFYGINK